MGTAFVRVARRRRGNRLAGLARNREVENSGETVEFGPRAFPGRGGPIGVVKPPRARGGCLGVVRNSGVEGCDKPGGAASRASIPGFPRNTQGTETSQYLEERKSTETPSVAASERGRAQTGRVTVRGRGPGAMKKRGEPKSSGKSRQSG